MRSAEELSDNWTVWKREVTGYYCSSLVYKILIKEHITTNRNGEGKMQVTVETFQKCASELPKNLMHRNRIEHKE